MSLEAHQLGSFTVDLAGSKKVALHPQKFASNAPEIAAAFKHAGIDTDAVWMLDSEYRILPRDEMMECVKAAHTSSEQYISDFHDCDSFGRELWSRVPWMSKCNSVGLVLNFGGVHCFNCVLVRPDRNSREVECLIIEPQSDGIVKLGSSPPYTLTSGEYKVIL